MYLSNQKYLYVQTWVYFLKEVRFDHPLEMGTGYITVNVIAPGPVLTQNFWDLVPKDSELQQEISDNIPVGRIGTTGDIANAVEFFLDEKASFVTGQVLYVCGGTSLKGLGT